jgi:hypothetical protein
MATTRVERAPSRGNEQVRLDPRSAPHHPAKDVVDKAKAEGIKLSIISLPTRWQRRKRVAAREARPRAGPPAGRRRFGREPRARLPQAQFDRLAEGRGLSERPAPERRTLGVFVRRSTRWRTLRSRVTIHDCRDQDTPRRRRCYARRSSPTIIDQAWLTFAPPSRRPESMSKRVKREG